MKIERAVREKTFTLTSIAGPSGSGKTYSALLYARGLVGAEGKIGFIDTENKRSRFYADVAGGFDVIDLDPPFSSQRYIEAITAFEKAGYTAIIVDSISHEWEGTGGVLEQAEAIEQSTKRAGLHCWQKPKAGHKKLMNGLLQTRAHLIFCCRVKEKVTQVKVGGKTEIVNEGFVVVQEKSFIYEMTVSMMLSEGTHIPVIQKCPGDLLFAFAEGRRITTDAGGSVRQWSDQGVVLDEALEDAKREGLLAANNGTASLMDWWKGLGPRRASLEGMKETFKSIARATDQLKTDINDAGGGDPSDRLAAAKAANGERAADSQEGFSMGHVTDTLGRKPSTNQEPSGEVPPSDAGSGAAIPLDGSAADQTAGDGEAEEGATEAAHGEQAAPSSDLNEPEWLLGFARAMVAAIGVDEAFVVATSKGGFVDGLSDDTRDRARAITNYARSVCRGEIDKADALEVIAGKARCEVAALEQKGGA